jgi:hypothetical protein
MIMHLGLRFCARRRTDSPIRQKFALLLSKKNFDSSDIPRIRHYRQRLGDISRSPAVAVSVARSGKNRQR